MKRLLSFLAALLLCMFPMNAIAFNPDGDEEDPDPEEINLGNQNAGEDPTSQNSTHISAFKAGTILTIYVNNYLGSVDVAILGINGHITSNQNSIAGSGVIVLNLTSLPSGAYSLLITAGHLYQGDFAI